MIKAKIVFVNGFHIWALSLFYRSHGIPDVWQTLEESFRSYRDAQLEINGHNQPDDAPALVQITAPQPVESETESSNPQLVESETKSSNPQPAESDTVSSDPQQVESDTVSSDPQPAESETEARTEHLLSIGKSLLYNYIDNSSLLFLPQFVDHKQYSM